MAQNSQMPARLIQCFNIGGAFDNHGNGQEAALLGR
jgi:hypothetical protein